MSNIIAADGNNVVAADGNNIVAADAVLGTSLEYATVSYEDRVAFVGMEVRAGAVSTEPRSALVADREG